MSNSNQFLRSRTWRRQYLASAWQVRSLTPRFFIGILVCAGGLILPACSASQGPSSSTKSAETLQSAFTTPPFSTREPDRYQAIRITSLTETGSTESSSSLQSNQVLIARDGEKRREEYSAGATKQIVYLEIPEGRFIVLPASRLYADLSTASHATDSGNRHDSPTDSQGLSTDQLLNKAHAPAMYEKLGSEMLAGRTTTKYRVVLAGVDNQNETLIWIDEALGMPVRSEAMSESSGHSTKVTMELKDVKLEVDERLFSWPSDYRKVEARLIFDLIRKEGEPATRQHEAK